MDIRRRTVQLDSEAIARLFPADVSVCIASPDMYRARLFPAEAALLARAVERRRAEFTAGRAAARAALARFGLPACPIPRGPGREPVWPRGFSGSITHCDGFCCAVVTRVSELPSLGIDVEAGGPLEDSVARLICRPEEFAHFAGLPDLPGASWARLAFSAKEAFHKCCYPLTGQMLDFLDVRVRFAASDGTATGTFTMAVVAPGRGRALPPHSTMGAWAVDDARVYAAVAARAPMLL
ncbi:4'-phosphopantetheinyl transferase family protein [Belnapia moabensis]|uniref:4'-phosphopantetheinyl transferase family protein n=1 Tax=Belnapia moabensis TaxID=365533 RepID=UPI0006950A93|nr:4'-phosphopantetheinyl transferase superfamily protein [Belnapia moabensis]